MQKAVYPIVLGVVAACAVLLVAPQEAPAAKPTVAGLNELVILDPGTHERGLPAVRLAQSPHGLVVEIPPKVHVHRYYYNGDKEFQGPIVQGGPTVVVANHPTTGRMMYVNASLPGGAPKIVHSRAGITYVYPDRRVVISFSRCSPETAVVAHKNGQGWGQRIQGWRESVDGSVQEHLQRSPLAQSVKETTLGGGELLSGAGTAAEETTANFLDRLRGAAGSFPGVSALRGYAEQRPVRAEQRALEAAAADKTRFATDFMPTNR